MINKNNPFPDPDNNSFGEIGVFDSDPNNWPAIRLKPEPRISNRAFWRYPKRMDFFELQPMAVRVDWKHREIDRHAKRADGLLIWVAQPMTFFEEIIWNPRLGFLKYRLDRISWWFKART